MLELTERALTDRPAEMLARVEALRGLGLAMALDDVGADHRSLALMPFVAPEVIKLDLRLVQENPTPAIAAIVHAVNAESERSGALLLAEGIETRRATRDRPRAGRPLRPGLAVRPPGAAAAAVGRRLGVLAPRRPRRRAPRSPYEAVAAASARAAAPSSCCSRSPSTSRPRSQPRERPPSSSPPSSTPATSPRPAPPATSASQRTPPSSAPSASASPTNPPQASAAPASTRRRAAGEWNVVVVAPHFAAAFVARDLGDAATTTWPAASTSASPTTATSRSKPPAACSPASPRNSAA